MKVYLVAKESKWRPSNDFRHSYEYLPLSDALHVREAINTPLGQELQLRKYYNEPDNIYVSVSCGHADLLGPFGSQEAALVALRLIEMDDLNKLLTTLTKEGKNVLKYP